MATGNLGHLAATVSLNIDPFTTKSAALKATIKATTAELKAQDAAFGKSGKSITNMRSQYQTMVKQADNLKRQLELNKTTLDKNTAAMNKNGTDVEKTKSKVANAAAAYNKTAAQASLLNQRMFALRREILLQESGWMKASAGALCFSETTGKIGNTLSNFGKRATMTVTAPIAIGLGTATKAAVDFSSEIANIGPLLTNGETVTAKYKKQLDAMAESSKKWAIQYGTSTSAINDGMSEMVKRGYTASQTMGAMPAVLDAAKASGDDFNEVMHVSTSVLEQFGLKTESTVGMLRNTSRVTDALTYVANATAAGFKDMGDAMTYVGPSAHAAGISLEETAAAIGLMSNQGIEGSVAGTALRGALTRLMKPSKQNTEGFAKLGIQVADFKKGTLTLPQILDKIKTNTKGWTDQQRAAAIALAFGTEAQAGMNALVSEGGAELVKYTNNARNAGGTTKKIADAMNQTQAAKVARFKESLHVLGITIGQQLLPTLTPLIEQGTNLVKKFAEMDAGTQQTILKMALLAAAAGPVSSALGGVFKIISGGAKGFSAFASGIGRMTTAAKLGSTGFDVLKSAFSKTSFEALKAAPAFEKTAATALKTGTAMTAAGEGGTSLLAAIGPLGVGLGAVAVAGAAGYAVWKIWGEKAVEAGQRTARWGTDIGEWADKSASKMRQASGEIAGAFNNTNQTVKQNATTIVNGFNAMTAAAKEAATESDTAARKLADELGGAAGQALKEQADKEKAANDKRLSEMEKNNQMAESIARSSADKNVKLTADQLQILDNLRRDNADKAIKTLHLSGENEKNVLKAILGEKVTMSKEAAEKQATDMRNSLVKEWEDYGKAKDKINNDAKLSTAERNAALEGLESDHAERINMIYQGMVQAQMAQGKSAEEASKALQEAFGITALEADAAVKQYQEAMNGIAKSTDQMAAAVNKTMDKDMQKAGNTWNALVLDPKTGKVVTNLDQVLKDAASTEKGWEQLEFIQQNADINSNAKQKISEAMAATDKWNKLRPQDKSYIVQMEGREELAKVMNKFIAWNQFTLKQQQAIVHGDYSPLVAALIKSGDWNTMELKEKEAIVKDKASVPLIDALVKSKEWNNLPDTVKNAIVNSKGQGDLAALAAQYKLWNNFDDKQLEAMVKATGESKLADMIIKYKTWNDTPDKVKNLLVNNKDARQKLKDANIDLSKWDIRTPTQKNLDGNNKPINQKIDVSNQKIDDYNLNHNVKDKKFDGDSKPLVNAANQANNGINTYNAAHPGQKTFKGVDQASGPANRATNSVKAYGGNETITKTFAINIGANSIAAINKLNSLFETGTSDFEGGLATINDASGSQYREVVTLPNGAKFVAQGRNVTLPLPKHTKVETAMQSASRYNIPKFATGTSDFTGAAASLGRMRLEQTTVTTSSDSGLASVVSRLSDMVALLLDYKPSVEGQVVLEDGRAVGAFVADGVTREQNRQQRIMNRRGGRY